MNLLKKFLRGVFYFCVGVKASCRDLVDWYTHNRSIPRFLRHPVVLLVLALALVGCGWGLVMAVGSASLEERHVPSSSQAASQPESQPQEDIPSSAPEQNTSSSAPEEESSNSPSEQDVSSSNPEEESSSDESEQESSSSQPEVDAIASATRFDPIGDDQLRQVLQERVDAYYEEVVFIPPAAGDIAGWQAVNPDVRAWITIPNTNISYPVVIGPYTDYYTHLGYYKEASRNGVIWFDTDVQFDQNGEITSRNAVIYGHNWTNCWRPVRIGNPGDVMFAQLAAYDDATFTAQNPYIRITTPGGDHLYQVFSVFYTDLSFVYVYCDGSVVDSIISRAKALDIHDLNVPVSSSDQIITLSTCTRVLGPGDNQRFVVMAKKIS